MDMVMENKKLREIDIHTYLPVLIDIIQSGKEVNLLITGSSMAPFLCHQRDTIIISKPKAAFYVGEMVFYQRLNGQYVMHRICRINKDGTLWVIGDAQTEKEKIDETQIFGVVHQVVRKGKLIQKGDLWWNFFEKIWIYIIPFRPLLIKSYGILKKKIE